MGIFSARFTKPGPGVSKDASQKRRIVIFFEIFIRKFWKLLQLNFLFIAACIPVLAVFILVNLLLEALFPANLLTQLIGLMPLSLFSLPVLGMVYICRNFAREEHAFLWHDFIDQIKKNWKKGALHGLVTFLVSYFAVFSAMFYFQKASEGFFWLIPAILAVLLLVVFLFMQYYVYTLIITFDLSYKNILKNAAIFSVAGFLRNLCLSIFIVPIWGLVFLCLMGPMFETLIPGASGLFLLPLPFIIFGMCSLTCFIVCFVTYPLISRYMIEPVYSKEAANAPRPDDHYHPIEDKETEYVFENGRLIKKSAAEVEQVFDDEVK